MANPTHLFFFFKDLTVISFKPLCFVKSDRFSSKKPGFKLSDESFQTFQKRTEMSSGKQTI